MKKLILTFIVLAAVGGGAAAYYILSEAKNCRRGEDATHGVTTLDEI